MSSIDHPHQSGANLESAVLVAYEGDPDCVSLHCRRFLGPGLEITPGCIGWHCSECRNPSGQYGHSVCQEVAAWTR